MAATEFFSQASPVVTAIRNEMARGKRAAAAMDFVCGDGAYAKFSREVWEACRATPGQLSWDFGPERLGAVSK